MKTFHAIKLWVAWVLAMGLWLADPFLSMRYYEVTQRLRFYPTAADSIGIPILGAFFMAIVGLPFWFFFCRKAFRHLSGPFMPIKWPPTRIWATLGITLAFGFCIYSNMQSARHYHFLFQKMRQSEFAHLSELAHYLMISSYGWAILWVILGMCCLTGIHRGKPADVPSSPKIPLVMMATISTS
jgi:hypothetical protein